MSSGIKEYLIFDAMKKSYYRITAIDEYSRKRILEMVDEKNATNISEFVRTLKSLRKIKNKYNINRQ